MPKDPSYSGADSNVGGAMATCQSGKDNAPKKDKEKIHKKFRASMFFDGTQNNRNNIDDRKRAQETVKLWDTNGSIGAQGSSFEKVVRQRANDEGSYASEHSNVAKLETYFLKNDPSFDAHFGKYIEGIGTTDFDTDSNYGMATGKGGTGVIAKVQKGVDNIVQSITSADCPDKIIDLIQLDAVGFSRGAAAARNFIYAAMLNSVDTVKMQLESKGYTVSEVKVKFVGLFDTVAALGLTGHDKDTSILHLDAVAQADSVLQLTAAGEYRKNFPVTNIASKGGNEIYLPGVHSDIGGGYNDYKDEDLTLMDLGYFSTEARKKRLERDKAWLISEGWYKEDEIDISSNTETKVKKTGIRSTYSRIPMYIMMQHFSKSNVTFDMDIKINEPLPDPDHPDLNTLYGYIGADGSGNWRADNELLKRIRHRYFHFSANHNSIANPPRYVAGGSPMDGNRERGIYAG